MTSFHVVMTIVEILLHQK